MKNTVAVKSEVAVFEHGPDVRCANALLPPATPKQRNLSSLKKIGRSNTKSGSSPDASDSLQIAHHLISTEPLQNAAVEEIVDDDEITDTENLSNASTPAELVELFCRQFPYREKLRSAPKSLQLKKMEELLKVSSAEELVILFDWLFIRQENNIEWQNQMRNWRMPIHVFFSALGDIRQDYGLETGTFQTEEELEDEFLAERYPDVIDWMRRGIHKFQCGMADDLVTQQNLLYQKELREKQTEKELQLERERPAREAAEQVRLERERRLAEAIDLIDTKRDTYRGSFVRVFHTAAAPRDRDEERRRKRHITETGLRLIAEEQIELQALRDGWDAASQESPEAAEAFLEAIVVDLKGKIAAAGDQSIKDMVLAEIPDYEGCVAAVAALQQKRASKPDAA